METTRPLLMETASINGDYTASIIPYSRVHTHTQEVVALVKEGRLVLDSQAGRCIGYRQVLEYLQDVWGFPQEGVASTRQEGGASTPQVGVASNAGKLYSLKVGKKICG